ncbi:zinc finger and BTB domain-containing protein 11-like [Gossypium australe]|uniref:Zinc finger and BTB domain-containing protein 11-like n=1 Tax=Gossypium australe TaxID=47621 RepID=A0A5B6VGD0_9ROSI|nr:zinc finger and BTB domain-containing protein 11-like [Gossypium australe]
MTDLIAMFATLRLVDDEGLLVELQSLDVSLLSRIKQVEDGKTKDFGFNVDGILCFRGRYCMMNDKGLRQPILRELHSNPYLIHPRGNKMYCDLRELYWFLIWKIAISVANVTFKIQL